MGKRKQNTTANDRGLLQKVLSVSARWILGILLTGIAYAVFENVFDVCGLAIKNASTGLFRKFIDTYYIRAAQSEIMDCATQCSVIASLWILTTYAITTGYLWGRIAALRDAIRGIREKTKKVDKEQRYFKVIRIGRATSLLMIVVSFLFLYTLSLNVVAYGLHRDFNHSLRYVRCVIDDAKCFELDGMWIRMQSKADHEKIKVILDRYTKSADEKLSAGTHAALR